MRDAPSVPKLTRKEQARQQRRAAYQEAKQRRAADPRMIALKEAMKVRQRAAYQAAKERRKALVAEQAPCVRVVVAWASSKTGRGENATKS